MASRSPVRELFIFIAVLGVLAVLFCGACGGVVYLIVTNFDDALGELASRDSGPVMDLQKQDYAEARRSFQTRLTRRGPSPQTYRPVPAPADVKVVDVLSENLKLKAWVNAPPPGQPPKPAVLYLHSGFAFGREDWDQCKPFRDAGFVTMVPILRGENGQPGHFTMFYDEVDDVLAAAEVLAQMPGVDENRIYVSGHSAGGTLALLAAMASKRFRAAASFSGSPDQAAFSEDWPELVVFDKRKPRELQMRSPLAYATSFHCPVRMYFGTREPAFRKATQRTAERARQAGLDVAAISVPGDHDSAVDPALKQAIAFFRSQ